MPAQIIRARAENAAEITQLARESFWETFSRFNLASDMNLYMDQAFNAEKQTREILDSKTHTFVVRAESQPNLAGFFQLVESLPEKAVTAGHSIELSRFYFLKSSHGKGIAAETMRFCLSYARDQQYERIWLGVWEENHRARAFYRKFGFTTVGAHVFQLGDDPQNDLILERELATIKDP